MSNIPPVELEDVTPAKSFGGSQLKFVKLQEFGEQGAQKSGIYLRSFENTKSKFKQQTHVIFTTDNEMIGLNGSFEIDGYFEVIDPDRFVVVTYLGKETFKDKNTGEEKTKYLGKVQCGKENQFVADLRTLAKQADSKKEEEEKKDEKPKSSGKLDGLFKGNPNAGIPH